MSVFFLFDPRYDRIKLLWQLASILSTPIASLTDTRSSGIGLLRHRHTADPFFKPFWQEADCFFVCSHSDAIFGSHDDSCRLLLIDRPSISSIGTNPRSLRLHPHQLFHRHTADPSCDPTHGSMALCHPVPCLCSTLSILSPGMISN